MQPNCGKYLLSVFLALISSQHQGQMWRAGHILYLIFIYAYGSAWKEMDNFGGLPYFFLLAVSVRAQQWLNQMLDQTTFGCAACQSHFTGNTLVPSGLVASNSTG